MDVPQAAFSLNSDDKVAQIKEALTEEPRLSPVLEPIHKGCCNEHTHSTKKQKLDTDDCTKSTATSMRSINSQTLEKKAPAAADSTATTMSDRAARSRVARRAGSHFRFRPFWDHRRLEKRGADHFFN